MKLRHSIFFGIIAKKTWKKYFSPVALNILGKKYYFSPMALNILGLDWDFDIVITLFKIAVNENQKN